MVSFLVGFTTSIGLHILNYYRYNHTAQSKLS